MYLPIDQNAEPPKFKECAKHPKIKNDGFVIFYTDQCPFTYYWVPKVQEAAKEHGIAIKNRSHRKQGNGTKCTNSCYDLCFIS